MSCRVRGSLVLVAALLSACGISRRRNFKEVVPDLELLVTTADPRGMRAQLSDVALPEGRVHADQLLAMLRRLEAIDAAHLVLLVRSVALPENVVCTSEDGRWSYPLRGKSEHAPVVEQLLTEGAQKLRNVDAYWLGELLGISQTDATMLLLCKRFVPEVDDGSNHALRELLRGMPGSPALIPFLSQYMGPQGRLDGDRGWFAFEAMSFDIDRAQLLAILMDRRDSVTAERMVRLVRAFSFDNGRARAMELLVGRVDALDYDVVYELLETFSFDSGRTAALKTVANHGGMPLDEDQLTRLLALCSFDSGRVDCVRLFAQALRGEPSSVAATRLLQAFSFDSDRLKALEVLAPRWRELAEADRRQLLAACSFDSSRATAKKMLGL